MTFGNSKVKISAVTLESYKEALNDLNPDTDYLFVDTIPEGIEGKRFIYRQQIFTVTGVDLESNEEPLLAAMLQGFEDYEKDVECGDLEKGYYTSDGTPTDNFPTDFINHTGWKFNACERYAKNVPGLEEGALIGFYWIPLSGIMDELYSP